MAEDLIEMRPSVSIKQAAPTPPANAPVEPVVTTPTSETPPASAPVEPKSPETKIEPTEWQFNLDGFNKKFGKQFKNEDEFTSSLKELDSIGSLKDESKKVREFQTKYEELLAEYEPRKAFVSDQEYERQLLLRKYPNENISAINRILSTDLKSASDLDILALRELRKIPDMSDTDARQIALHKIGIDTEESLNELKESDPNRYRLLTNMMKSEAVDVRNQLSEFKKVEIPQTNFEEQKRLRVEAEQKRLSDLSEKSKPFVDEVFNNMKDVKLFKSNDEGKLEEALTYNVSDDISRDIKKATHEQWVKEGWGLDKDGYEKAQSFAYSLAVMSNLDKILSRYEKNIVTREKEKTHELVHSDAPINTAEAPRENTKTEELKNFLEGISTQRKGKIEL